MKGTQASIVLSLLAVFGSGIVVGAIGYHSYTTKSVGAVNKVPPRDPQEWRRQYTEEITSRLQLDPTQTGHLNGILDETRNRFKDLKDREHREADQIKARQTEEIRAILAPAQVAEFEKFRAERAQRAKDRAKQSPPN